MEKINTEILVNSLLKIGFDKIDPALFTYTLGKLSVDNQRLQLFEFEDSETHQIFNKYVECDRAVFKLKDGITLDTEAWYYFGKFYSLREMLNTNKKLIEYLSQLDFSEIILKKAKLYGVQSLEQLDESKFSSKEVEILKHLNFGQIDNLANRKYVTLKDSLEKMPILIPDDIIIGNAFLSTGRDIMTKEEIYNYWHIVDKILPELYYTCGNNNAFMEFYGMYDFLFKRVNNSLELTANKKKLEEYFRIGMPNQVFNLLDEAGLKYNSVLKEEKVPVKKLTKKDNK